MDSGSKLLEWITQNLAYAWFVLLAAWGGTANYLTRQRRDNLPFSTAALLGEWSISGFSGLITAYMCVHLELSFALTAAAAGVAGHMGGRAVYFIEQMLVSKVKS